MVLSNTLKRILFLLIVVNSVFSISAFASDKEDIAQIIANKTAPDGIVFEVIGSDAEYLSQALEKIENYRDQLRQKFPKLDIAVVSHGSEQFALTSNNAVKHKNTHSKVKRIVASDIPVHICETHASWRDVSAEDFPDYVSPTPQAPAQIKQYQELGYTLVIVD